jgi:hypothetical protein
MLAYYHELLRLRREVPALALLEKTHTRITWLVQDRVLQMERWAPCSHVLALFHLHPEDTRIEMPGGIGKVLLDSSERRWGGVADTRQASHNQATPLALAGHHVIVTEKA